MKNADRRIHEIILIAAIFLAGCDSSSSLISASAFPAQTAEPSVSAGSDIEQISVLERLQKTDPGMVEFVAVNENIEIPLMYQTYLKDSDLQEKLSQANQSLSDMYTGIQSILAEGQLTELTDSRVREDTLAYYFMLHDEDTSIFYIYTDGTLKTVSSSERKFWQCDRGERIISLGQKGAQAFQDFADAMNSSSKG